MKLEADFLVVACAVVMTGDRREPLHHADQSDEYRNGNSQTNGNSGQVGGTEMDGH